MNEKHISRRYKSYDDDFRKRAVELADRIGVIAAERELGVARTQIYRWKKRMDDVDPPKLGSLANVSMKQVLEENKRLRQENEILKKAKAYFKKQRE